MLFLQFDSVSDSMSRRSSVLQWHPDVATQLFVASDDDSSPTLKVIIHINIIYNLFVLKLVLSMV